MGYTGSGIKIGMIESGVPDSSESCFSGVDITYDTSIENIGHKYSDHANMVAAIMVGQETTFHGVTYGEGIVPDADLYVTCCDNSDAWRSRVEWLLSQGVHVINMSASLGGMNDGGYQGYYGVLERWLDHIAYSHYVHFVTVAGNNGWGVTSPGMAYNVLTVGAINDNNTIDDDTDDELYGDSSYEEFSDLSTGTPPTNKPDLVAPGVNITTIAGTFTGTSCAAPHVTAIVAQVCGFIPSLKVMPSVVKAVLTASVSHSEHAYNTGFMGEGYDQFGAGVVNAKAAFETLYAYRMMGGSFPAKCDADEVKIFTFTASSNQRVRVSLTWQKEAYLPDNVSHSICDPSERGVVDLDLCIYDPDGVLVGDWRADDNNTEIADFVAAKSGTYTIKVQIRESPSNDIPIGIAWWLAPTNNLSSSN